MQQTIQLSVDLPADLVRRLALHVAAEELNAFVRRLLEQALLAVDGENSSPKEVAPEIKRNKQLTRAIARVGPTMGKGMAADAVSASNSMDEFEPWRDCGEVGAVNSKGDYTVPPKVPQWAGCYRLVLKDGDEYFGEGFNLYRRVGESCDNASSKEDFARRDRIKRAGGMKVYVSVQSHAKGSFSKFEEHKRDFPGAKEARERFEARSEQEAKTRGVHTLNNRGERRI